MIRVTRGYHSAWVPEGQNTKIVLFGGDEKEAVGTADVVGGGKHWSYIPISCPGGRSFELQNGGLHSCAISLSSSFILTGGSDYSSNIHSSVARYQWVIESYTVAKFCSQAWLKMNQTNIYQISPDFFRYDISGFVETLPSLRISRQQHACGMIQGKDGKSVRSFFLDPT